MKLCSVGIVLSWAGLGWVRLGRVVFFRVWLGSAGLCPVGFVLGWDRVGRFVWHCLTVGSCCGNVDGSGWGGKGEVE